MIQFDYEFLVNLLNAGVRMAIPVILASVGCVFAERAGVLNISLEGQMLAGAFMAFITTYFTGNLNLGIVGGILGGCLMALILAVAGITLRANQTITGIALNMFASGATSFGFWILFGVSTTTPIIEKLPNYPIPGLSSIPVLGEMLFQHSVLVYLAYLLVAVCYVVLFKTTFGLKLRACGEHPKAAETMGVNVLATRYMGSLICGGLAGLGGAFLSLVALGMFADDVTAGRGFVALAIVIFGRWHPLLCTLAALFFGTIDAFQLRVQASGAEIPYQFLLMLPYAFTLLTMMFTSKRAAGPACVGQPYEREQI